MHTSAAIGFLSLYALFLSAAQAQQYVISTFAGGVPPPTPVSGVNLYIEGGSLGISADAAGNIYFTAFNCVFKLDQDGIVTRIAGTSRPGYSGDGGPALRAQLQLEPTFNFEGVAPLPAGVAVDHAGNVFIGDNGNNRIRKISPDGIITTVAGNGESGRSGDGGFATGAQLTVPFSLAVDSRANLFIADHINHVVRKVSPDGMITTVAGNGIQGFSGDGNPAISAQLSYPSGLAVDDEGNLLISDYGNGRIRKVSTDGIISTVAGGGRCCNSPGDGAPATLAWLAPTNVAVDPAGNLFITDTNYDWFPDYFIQVVRKVSTDGTIATVAGSGRRCFSSAGSSDCDGDGGPAVRAVLNGTLGLAVDPAGNLLIADTGNNRIRKVYSDGIITTVVGAGTRIPSSDGGAAALANLLHPSAAAVDPAGNLFIADSNRIRKVSPDGIITTVAGNGANGWCATPPCPSGDGGVATAASLAYPTGLAVDGTGNVFVIDSTWRLRKISTDGIITNVAGNGIPGFSGDGGPAIDAQLTSGSMAADGAGNLFFSDYGGRIRKVSAAGIITTVAHGDAHAEDNRGDYYALAVDNRGNLFIGDRAHVGKVSDDGTITTVAGNGTSGYSGDGGPATDAQLTVGSIAVDSEGNLFIADYTQTRIRKVSPAGIITTVAGNGTFGYSGDGGPATDAQLSARSITVDGTGNVYVVDWVNNAVRILRPIKGSF